MALDLAFGGDGGAFDPLIAESLMGALRVVVREVLGDGAPQRRLALVV